MSTRALGSRRRRLAGVLVVIACGATAPSIAQTGTQAVLAGRIVDAAGSPLPGVTVTASSTLAPQPATSVTTDERGRYRISPLPPANDYLLIAAIPGYARVEVSPLDLDPGRTTTQDISLIPATQATERILVEGHGDLVDLATTRTATVFNSEFIEGLPLLGRSYQDLLTLAPGVTDVDGDGNPNVNGARDVDLQTRVDGANVTDPFTGTFGQNLNLEAIAEMEVITTGASAEFSQAQGGWANIVTKSGTNDFSGSFKFFFRTSMFDNDGANNNDVSGTNLFAALDGFQDLRPFLTLGGPIVHDRVWFFVALEYIDLQEPTNTLTTPVLRTSEGWQNFGKVTWQVGGAHRLSLQVTQDPRRYTGFGVVTGVAPESDFIQDQGGATTTARWTWTASPSVLVETLVSRFDTGIDILPATDAEPCVLDTLGRCNPFTEDLYTVDVRQGTASGPYHTTTRDSRQRDTFRSDLSLYRDGDSGGHNLKTGVEVALEGFTEQGRVDRIRFDDYGRSRSPGGNPNRRYEGSINFQEAVPSAQTREATGTNLGVYLQDSYRPFPNLTLNLGVRFDREENTADGFEPFDPAVQAQEFLSLYERANGLAPGAVSFQQAMVDATVLYDVNGDGLDNQHCSSYDLDGAVLGDGRPDSTVDDFYTLYDGDYDGVATPGDPDDLVLLVPDGIADGRGENPRCDRLSDDSFVLVSVFSRHQFDDVAAPYEAFQVLDPARGLPGNDRQREEFTLVSNNVAPRVSVAWDPWGDNRTKLFANWSRFYGELFLATLVPELGPDPRTIVYDANNQTVDASVLQGGRFTVTQIDRGMKTPFTDELTFGFERELAPEWTIGLTVIRRTGRDQIQDVDVNHFTQDQNGDGELDDYFGRVSQVTGDGDTPPHGGLHFAAAAVTSDGQPDLYAYNPFFNRVLRVGNFNASEYDAYQVALTRRLSRRWQMTGSYVLSRARGDAEAFQSSLGDDLGTVDDEYGYLDFDQTHRLILSGVTHLPGDQSLGGMIEWVSGLPYSRIRQKESADSFGSFTYRTTYPSGQRNDQRNEGRWLLNLHYRKGFAYRNLSASVGLDVENLLNTDDLVVAAVDVDAFLGVEGVRRFGRRWQLSAELNF